MDIALAMREAKAKIVSARQQKGAYDETQAVIKKHASRKGMQGASHDSGRDKSGQIISSKRLQKKSKLLNANIKQQELF